MRHSAPFHSNVDAAQQGCLLHFNLQSAAAMASPTVPGGGPRAAAASARQVDTRLRMGGLSAAGTRMHAC